MRSSVCWMVVLASTLSLTGCASRKDVAPSSAAGAAPADESPADESPANESPAADAEADAAEPLAQPGSVSSGDGAAPLEDDVSSAPKRKLTTVAEAESAFADDEGRLTQLLSGQATMLDTGTCGRVCDALASMRRSADAICDLAGDDDRRCDEARDRLQSNEDRVAGRGCGCS